MPTRLDLHKLFHLCLLDRPGIGVTGELGVTSERGVNLALGLLDTSFTLEHNRTQQNQTKLHGRCEQSTFDSVSRQHRPTRLMPCKKEAITPRTSGTVAAHLPGPHKKQPAIKPTYRNERGFGPTEMSVGSDGHELLGQNECGFGLTKMSVGLGGQN
jgi:hypothetical protein